MSRNRKQWTLTLNDELETKIMNYKKAYNLHENKEILSHMFDNILNLEQSTLTRINRICTNYNMTKEELLTPMIERYINKTLKKQGIVKDKNKHSSRAESELLDVLKNMVQEYKQKPLEERKFITASLVYRYLIINNHKQKNMSVIKRVLSGLSDIDISFIKEYHQENNLSVSSNLRKYSYE
jgi:hypothetical protein